MLVIVGRGSMVDSFQSEWFLQDSVEGSEGFDWVERELPPF